MDAILSHITALEVLRRWDSFKLVRRLAPADITCAPRQAPDVEQLGALVSLPVLAGATLPVHVLVDGRDGRRYTDAVFSHAALPAYPEGSLFLVAPGVACCGPELVALQMTEYATDLELTLLVDELCSHYSIQPSAEMGLVQRREPLTTLDKIRALIDALPGARGTKRLRSALAAARERSGSPQESKTCHQLECPRLMGGHAKRVVGLNDSVAVERAGSVLGGAAARIRKPDLMILAPGGDVGPERGAGTRFAAVAVDYQGVYHRDPVQEGKDIDRRNELLACDVKDYEIAKEHFADVGYLDWLAATLALPSQGSAHKRRRHTACGATSSTRSSAQSTACTGRDAPSTSSWLARAIFSARRSPAGAEARNASDIRMSEANPSDIRMSENPSAGHWTT